MDLSQLNQDQLTQLLSLVHLVQPPPAQPSINSPTVTVTGDTNSFNSERLRLQALVNSSQPAPNLAQVQVQASGSNVAPTQPNSSGPSSWMPNGQMQPTSAQPSPLSAANSPIGTYQSVRTMQNLPLAPQGHPSPSASMLPSSAGLSTQPFLGFGALGLNMRGAVNQRRLSSSANARNSTTTAVRRRTARGPAVAPPSLPVSAKPKITDCLDDVIDSNGILSQLLRVKVKVYPPMVRTCSRFLPQNMPR